MTDEAPRARRVPWGLVKLLFAGLVLLLVVRTVPFRDVLIWTAEDGSATLEGTIEGVWTEREIDFEVDPAALAQPDLPPSLRERFGASARVHLERGGPADWRPGMPRVFREMRTGGLVAALALMFCGILFTSTRWWRLLAAAECRTRWFDALRLTFLGFFFNLVIPGLTGGDLIKAVLVAREHPEQKARAAVSVAVDRIIGLFVLASLGAVVILFLGETFAAIRLPVMLCVAAGIVGAMVYSSRALRRLVRFDSVVSRIPGGNLIKTVDDAVLIYSRHPGTVLGALVLSLGNHLCVFGAITILARSFGERNLGLFEMFALVSVGNIVSSLPVAPAGWGVGEAVYGYLFAMLGSSATLGVATSITFRLALMFIGLCGGLFLLLPGGRDALREARG